MPVLSGPNLVDAAVYSKWNYRGFPGPYKRGNDVYFCWWNFVDGAVMWKSADLGVTWAMLFQVPAADGLLACGGSDAEKIRFLHWDTPGAGVFNITLAEFDMATDALGVIDNTLVTATAPVYLDHSRAIGEDRLFCVRQALPSPADGLYLRRFSGAWQAEQLVDTNVNHGLSSTAICCACSDPAGVTHVFYREGFAAGPANPYRVHYRQISPAGVLGAITADLQVANGLGEIPITGTRAAVFGDNIAISSRRADPARLPFVYYEAIIISGTPLAAPVFSTYLVGGNYSKETQIHTDQPDGAAGTQAWVWQIEYRDRTPPIYPTLDRLLVSSFDGTVVGALQLVHDEQANPSFPGIPAIQFQHDLAPPLYIGAGTFVYHVALEYEPVPGGWILCTGFAWMYGPVIPPPPPAVTVTQTGGTRRMVVLVPNYWDHCLLDGIRKWLYVPTKRPCCVPEPYDYFKWVQMPDGAIPFRKIGSVATPAPADGDVAVLDFGVPMGYDGIVRGNAHVYTGPNFGDGSGDIIWRIRIGNTYAKFLGNVLVQMGTVEQTHPIRDGIPVVSLRRMRYIVNVPNLSGGILIGDSRIVCALEGYFIPRR